MGRMRWQRVKISENVAIFIFIRIYKKMIEIKLLNIQATTMLYLSCEQRGGKFLYRSCFMGHSLPLANYTKSLLLLIPPRGNCISKKFFVKALKIR
ncbi:hypothetical protein O163_03625 [Caldanaerobacter subterraneus subsp. yonseiensis KB-1]|uniref:Uncharacterized protein n=1 Tax=Caldanaerobacter subterraneus subsp. yonseiensis KB-1 TaxID=1388761 RepID=U5CIE2_CALSX|nr:hypothetical protein O163_03625 [Caldanaerobacter subterraneus subsp. yonseiensis KB-1]